MRVRAGISLVDSVVGTHDTGSAGFDGVGKRPKVQFMKCTFIDVGAQSIDEGSVLLSSPGALCFLLVANKVLGARLYTNRLDTRDGSVHGDTREVRVGAETLPVSSAKGAAAHRTTGWSAITLAYF